VLEFYLQPDTSTILTAQQLTQTLRKHHAINTCGGTETYDFFQQALSDAHMFQFMNNSMRMRYQWMSSDPVCVGTTWMRTCIE
jgi:hypothetical protein